MRRENIPKSSGASSKDLEKTMPAATEAPSLIEFLAGGYIRDQKVTFPKLARLVSAYMPTGLRITASRIENIWRQEARRIDADEMDAIRAAARAREKQTEATVHAEYAEIREQVRQLATLLASMDHGALGASVSSQIRAIADQSEPLG